jgi:hypothetical protein
MYIPPAMITSTSWISSGSISYNIFVGLDDVLTEKAAKKMERTISMLRRCLGCAAESIMSVLKVLDEVHGRYAETGQRIGATLLVTTACPAVRSEGVVAHILA